MGEKNFLKYNLLIAEDDYENQKFLELYLKRFFDVSLCDSADTFYECMNKIKFDVILMDISLKGDKNGLELATEIRNDTKFSDIPIVCYTAHAYPRDRVNALNAGCDIYLSKPVDIKTLLDSIIEVLKKNNKFLSKT